MSTEPFDTPEIRQAFYEDEMSVNMLNEDGEVVVTLADGWSLRSGVYDQADPDALTSGEYVRLCRPDGEEYAYWDQEEWRADPALVMGAIINSAAGLRPAEEANVTRNDTLALDAIHALLDVHEWSGDTIEQVAEIVQGTGREIREP